MMVNVSDNKNSMQKGIKRTVKKTAQSVPANSPSREADLYFRQLKADGPAIEFLCRRIDAVLGEALAAEDSSALISLADYIESGEGNLAWQYIAEVRRILQILQTISLEVRYQMRPFSYDCCSKEEMLEKYAVMVFAVRRLIFRPSEESVEEAEQFLRLAECSPFALHIALQNELLPSKCSIYTRLKDVCGASWSEEERILFERMREMAAGV